MSKWREWEKQGLNDCQSIMENGNCKHKPDSKCLEPSQIIRGYFGPVNVCAPVAEVLKIKQVYGEEALIWIAEKKASA